MPRRINVILSEDTVRTIDRMAKPRERSRFIQRSVQHPVATASREALHERLRQAVLRDRDLDLEIGDDWSAVDQEQWQGLDRQEPQAEAGPRRAKSTSRRSTRQ